MTFSGIWRQLQYSLLSSNILPTYVTLLALVLLFHGHNVLVKSFTVFITDFAEIFWEKNPGVTPESGFSDSYAIP